MPGRRSKGGPRPPERTSLRPARGDKPQKLARSATALRQRRQDAQSNLEKLRSRCDVRVSSHSMSKQERSGSLEPPRGKSSEAIVEVPSLPQRPLIASSARHACPFQYELRYWNTFKKEFPECMGTTNLNCVDFLSASDGVG